MKRKLVLWILLFSFVMIGCARSTISPTSAHRDTRSVLAATDHACTSFCLDNGNHCVFGTNQDNRVDAGLLFVNQRNLLKTAWVPSTSGEYARWISKYGSATIVQAGYQLPWAGMNEAGLMISTMSLGETETPSSDERPPLVGSFWVQYQLDNHSTVEEVIASDALVRVADTVDHYLVCDRTGDCAVVEFLEGEMLCHTGASLPIQALTNSTYDDSLSAWQDGNLWKIKVLWVEPNGPAEEAGIMEGDWITAIDEVQLAGEQSLEALFSKIAQHQMGDEVELTIRHPGEAGTITVVVDMAARPADEDRIVLPAGVPAEILSLGFLPSFPGDFLVRFAIAADCVGAFEPTSSEEAVAYAFEALQAVSRHDTAWSIVFDPANLRVYFHTNRNPQIRYVDMSKLDFSCHTPVMMLDVHERVSGDISNGLGVYSHEASLRHTASFFEQYERVDLPPFLVDALLRGLESFPCMEGDASAMEDPAGYLEAHRPLLPPPVTWIALGVFHRMWPLWIPSTLLSLAFVVWRLTRSQPVSWGTLLVWALVVALLGPFGLLVYLLAHRKRPMEKAA